MSSQILAFFFILFLSCQEQRQQAPEPVLERVSTNRTERNIYRSADSMMAAFNRKDWPAFVRYNHPNMTSKMGGIDAFAAFVKMQMRQIPDSAEVEVSIGKILQVVRTQSDLQCLVEQHMRIQYRGSAIHKTTYLAGESLDEGNHWTFFDVSTKTGLLPKDIKPDISNELKIPAPKTEAS